MNYDRRLADQNSSSLSQSYPAVNFPKWKSRTKRAVSVDADDLQNVINGYSIFFFIESLNIRDYYYLPNRLIY